MRNQTALNAAYGLPMLTQFVDRLKNDAAWQIRGLVVIYSYQTAAEQQNNATCHDNGVGFTGVDAAILSSFAQQVNKGRTLSPKQMAIVCKKMPKYARQLWMIAANKAMAEAAKTTTAPKVELESEPKTTTVAVRSGYGYDSRISEWH